MDKERFYTNRRNIILLATLCCILWGSAYPAIKGGYDLFDISSNDISGKLIFAGYRFVLAGIIVLFIQALSKKNIFVLDRKQICQVTLLGIFQTTLQYIFFYVGLSYTTGIRSSILNGTGAFFSILLAHFLYENDKLNKDKIIGCIVGFIGVIIVSLNGQNFFDSSFSIEGEGFVILAALLSSVASIYGKRLPQNQDASIVTGYQLFIGGAILLISVYLLGGKLEGFTLKSTSLLIYMALLSSIAFAIWTQLLKYNKIGIISIFNFLIPIFGTLLSAVFLGENIFDIKVFISLILVCAGIYMVYKSKN